MNSKTKVKFRTYLKNNLSAHGGVVKRFKLLTYYVYAPLFHRSTPCPEPQSYFWDRFYRLCFHDIKSVKTHHTEARLCGARLG